MTAGEPVSVLIVDDEAPARAVLAEMVSRAPGVRLAGECANGFEAVKAAERERPDVVFLDIEMPKLNGFEVAELLDPSIALVFVTAYDSYAVEAFEIHAVDYVLKPFDEHRLLRALERARERIRARRAVDVGQLAAAARPPGQYVTRIVVKDGPRVHVIPVADLDSAQAQDDYVLLRSAGKSFLKRETLANLAQSLDPEAFVRVHRSYLVRLDRLRRLEATSKNSHAAVLADGSRVPLSRDGYSRLRAIFEPDRERGDKLPE